MKNSASMFRFDVFGREVTRPGATSYTPVSCLEAATAGAYVQGFQPL